MKIPSTAQVVELGEWEALVIPVPPTASFRWRKQKEQYPPKPPKPIAEYESVAGHTERVEALPESKEYNEWIQQMRIWKEECNAIAEKVAIEGSEFAYDYAILAWRHADETGAVSEWMTEPPNGWEPSGAYARHGLVPSDNLRLEFILHDLLCVDKYMALVTKIMYPNTLGTEGDTSPVTKEEVAAALATFQPGNEIPSATGRLGALARGRGVQRQHQDVEHGSPTPSGRQKGNRASWLVRIAQRLKNTSTGPR